MTLLTVAETLAQIQEPQAFGGQPAHWDEAMAAMPDGPLPFLDPTALPARRRAAALPDDHDPLLLAVAASVAADPALRQFAWYLHWSVFVAPEHGVAWGAPSLEKRLGQQAGLFYLLLSLDYVPALAAWHRRQGYAPEVTAETVKQISCFESNHLRGRGHPGMYESQFPWLSTYLVQPYVRLGRFEYQYHPYGGGVSVWKRESDGAVIALAENAVRVADDGLLLAAEAPPETGWRTHLSETAAAVCGNPVSPEGTILRRDVRLDRAFWKPCFRRGDTVLDLHIPAGGGMDWESMVTSFQRAVEFFGRHHADQPFKALVVGTWFMDPRLAELLPADANPLRLQRAVHLYPTYPGPGGLWFVFLRNAVNVDPDTLPADTSLQRALIRFMKSGRTWHGGGMFILPEELADPRENAYRERFAALRQELGWS